MHDTTTYDNIIRTLKTPACFDYLRIILRKKNEICVKKIDSSKIVMCAVCECTVVRDWS